MNLYRDDRASRFSRVLSKKVKFWIAFYGLLSLTNSKYGTGPIFDTQVIVRELASIDTYLFKKKYG